jgi:hypothetical protein
MWRRRTKKPLVERLASVGAPFDQPNWHEGEPNYVRKLGLSRDDVPALVQIAKGWTADEEPIEGTWHGPVHAWRALGQLRAAEAVEPLLKVLLGLNPPEDACCFEEFPRVFGLIGPPAIAPLHDYLTNPRKQLYARVAAAHGLFEIGKRHPESRLQAMEALSSQLAGHDRSAYEINGFVVRFLVDLNATGAAEVIERAFAANVIDESIADCWTVVRDDLGVEGLGLVPEPPVSQRRRDPILLVHGPAWPPEPHDRDRQQKKRKQAKAKRKQAQKARKRNRKRK